MNYKDVLINAKSCIGQYCKACVECNGKACKNQIPGPGAKGVGDTAVSYTHLGMMIMDMIKQSKHLTNL